MQYELAFREWDKQPTSRDALFHITQAGEYYRAVRVVVPQTLLFLVGQSLGLSDAWSALDSPEFQRGIYRLAVRSIENALKAGAIDPAKGNVLYLIELSEDDEGIRLLTDLARGHKTCSYQDSEGRDLYCTAASDADKTATRLTTTGRRAAPTSRPLCAACGLPDTDYICSHFLHPEIIGVRGGGGSIRRDVTGGLCDLNQPEFANMRACHAGGNSCWERIVEVETAPAVEHVPPQAIEQALDDLDVRWRLAFSNRSVVRLPGAEDVSVLALPCGSRDEFDRRLSSLADILKRLDIPDNMFEKGSEPPDQAHTLDRLELLFSSKLTEEDQAQLVAAVRTLRNINRIRAGGTHAGDAQRKRVRAAEAVGVSLDGRWGEAWDRVRALTSQAIRDLGTAARRVADAS